MAAVLKTKKGQKVNPKSLPEERARPAGTGPRPWKYDSVANGLTPSKLSKIYKDADGGDLKALLTLAGEIERRDSHVGAQIRTRKLALAGRPWIAEATGDSTAEEALASEVQNLLRSPAFSGLVFDLLDGLMKPFSVCEIVWELGDLFIPVEFKWRDQRSFAVDLNDGETLLLKTEKNTKGEPLEPWKYITHAPKQFSGSLVSGGLIRPCGVMYTLKTMGISAWLAFVELFGLPWRVGKYSKDASDADKTKLAEAVQVLGMDGGIILPDGMDIAVENAMGSGSGTEMHQMLAEWCDQQTSKAIVGQTLTADTGGGSYAQGSIHEGIRRMLLQADAKDLAATIQRDLIEPYVLINYGEMVPAPRIRCMVDDPSDKKSYVDMLIPLIDRGLRVEQSVVRDMIGLESPADGGEVSIMTPVGTRETTPTG